MVKIVAFSMTMASASVDDDSTSLLQVFAGVRHSRAQRVIDAVADASQDTICVQAAIGDVAPVTGTFSSNKMSQHAVTVAAGSVAEEAGSFCVPKQDVLLMQRTFGLSTAGELEAALGAKTTTTTTTTTRYWIASKDFEGDRTDVTKNGLLTAAYDVKVGECSNAMTAKAHEAQQAQNMLDTAVSQKATKEVVKSQEKAGWLQDNLDTVRICRCRNFLKSSVEQILSEKFEDMLKIRDQKFDHALLQRNLDTALGPKNQKKATTTTTTVPNGHVDEKMWPQFMALSTACTAASPERYRSHKKSCGPGCSRYSAGWTHGRDEEGQKLTWGSIAKLLNDPEIVPLYKSSNITEGWQNCDQSWVVQSACYPYLAFLYKPNKPSKMGPKCNKDCGIVGFQNGTKMQNPRCTSLCNKDYAQCPKVCNSRCQGPGCLEVQTICGCPGVKNK